MSGILQQGYSLGYVFAACANLGVGGSTDSWKTVFWIAGWFSIRKMGFALFLTMFSWYLDRDRSRPYSFPRVSTVPRSQKGREKIRPQSVLERDQGYATPAVENVRLLHFFNDLGKSPTLKETHRG